MCAFNVRTLGLCVIVCVLLLAASAWATDIPVTLAGQWGGTCCATAISGTHAYMGMGPRLLVVDVSTPSTPRVVGMSPVLPDAIWGVTVSGNYVYVAAYTGGLQIIDVSDPTNPLRVGAYDTPGSAVGVAVSGNHAYVADYYSGLEIIDITNPASPFLAGSYDTVGVAVAVAVSGYYAYVADDWAGIEIINISNPATPILTGGYNTGGHVRGVAVYGNYVCAADSDLGMPVINVSNPAAPTLAGGCATTGIAQAVSVAGSHAYVADYSAGLQVIDLANPASPTIVGHYDTTAYTIGVAASGSRAYVANYSNGMQIVNVSSPGSPTLEGTVDTSGYAIAVAIQGNNAYIADYDYGLRVVDVTNPYAPGPLASCRTNGFAWGVTITVSGSYVYIADRDSGVEIVNISNPSSPVRVGGYDTPGTAFQVAISGRYAYVADYGSGLQILDIINPASPVRVGGVKVTGNYIYAVAVSGNYAYLADSSAGLRVIDVTNRAAPRQVATRKTPGSAGGIAVSGNYAYVADYATGLQVIDISNPLAPTIVASCDTPGYARSVTLAGHYAYVADYASGLQIIDIAQPTAPVLVGRFDTSGYARGVAISGDYAYIADDYGGLVVVRVGDTVPLISAITPNSGANSGAVAITNISGAGFELGATVTLTKAGESDISGANVTVVSPSKITCSFDLTGKAAGQWNLVVTNPNSLSGILNNVFNITLPPPQITSVTPSSGDNNGTISITNLSGAGFQTGANVKLTRTGQADIPGTNVVVLTASQITCSFDLANKASGAWTVVVTNPDFQSAQFTEGFTVTANQPTITGITPNSGSNIRSISITNLAGTNFVSGATVKLTKPGQSDVAGSDVNVVNAAKITCSFDLTGKAAGQWNVIVTNPNGQSGQLDAGFTVWADQPPSIKAITIAPALAAADDQVHISVDATDDDSVTGVTANGTALTCSGGSIWDGNIPAASALGVHSVAIVVSDSGGHSTNDETHSYKTARILAASNPGLCSAAAALMANDCIYLTFGRVSVIDSDTFNLNDGSNSTIHVSAAGHGLQTGDYVSVRGIWRTDLTPSTLCGVTAHVSRLRQAP